MTEKKPEQEQFSGIKGMWFFAMFDLPVGSKKERKEYTRFRKALVGSGFTMLQFSVYAKYCTSRENTVTYQNGIKKILPPDGQVRLLFITDKQFSDQLIFYGKEPLKPEEIPEQYVLF